MPLSRSACAAAAGAVAVLVAAAPGEAVQRPPMSASTEPSTASFPPLVGSAPTSGAVDLDPETCAQAEAIFCDTVPIDVMRAGDLSVEVGWADLDGGTDDIDVILYDAGPGGQYSKLGSSETAGRPELVQIRVPIGLVNLVVVHYAGANNGYSVTTSVADASGAPPVNPQPAPGKPSAGAVVTERPAPAPSTTRQSARAARRQSPGVRPDGTTDAVPDAPIVDASKDPSVGRSRNQASGPVDDGPTGADVGWVAWLAVVSTAPFGAWIFYSARRRSAVT